MHILIGLITTIAGAIWALYHLHNAVNLNSFNPFYWMRRRKWEKEYGTKPLHRLDNSMEAAAVLVVAMTELEGAVTQEHKQKVIGLFIEEFGTDKRAALDLYALCSHHLKDVANIAEEVKKILAPTIAQFEERHKKSLLEMINTTATFSQGELSQSQQALLTAVDKELNLVEEVAASW
ncbi:MAG: hypothetical protein K6L76_02915 [Agarilytica sp.]